MRFEQVRAEQAIWEAIRGFKEPFSHDQLQNRCRKEEKAIGRFLRALRAAGYLVQIDTDDGGVHYKLEKDVGHEAPRLTLTGKPAEQRYGAEQMWRVMRARRQDGFAVADLVAHAGFPITTTEARNYIQMLLSCGYLKVIQKSSPRCGRVARYKLVKDTGPQPPVLQNIRQLYDPNTGKAVLPGGQA